MCKTALKYHLVTFGCQMNLADSQRIRGILESAGYESVTDVQDANVILFNTCCVRENAQQRLYGRINSLAQQKKQNKDLIIAVAGCVAQNEKEKLFKDLPLVDLVFGPNDTEELQQMLISAKTKKTSGCFKERGVFDGDFAEGIVLNRPFSAMVNIIRGCTNYCAYCVVPYVRGPEVSRNPEQIVEFISDLASKGVKEITLLGQNVNAYGKDIGIKDGFAFLLEEVEQIDGIEWVRFMTSHPRDFNANTIERIARLKKVCEHYHLPLQSGSDEILTAMKRGYSVRQYFDLVEQVRTNIPGAAITTDIICGFPGETECDFSKTLEVASKVGFDSAFMYYYSPRAGTSAESLPGQLSESVRKERLARLIELQNSIGLKKSQMLVGKKHKVFVESLNQRAGARNLVGKTRTGRSVDFLGTEDLIGKFVDLIITHARNWTLSGRLLDSSEETI